MQLPLVSHRRRDEREVARCDATCQAEKQRALALDLRLRRGLLF